MVWAKLDDAILDNPKIARVGVLGFALHVAAITWSCRNLTDGFIPNGRVECLLDFGGMASEVALSMCDNLNAVDGLLGRITTSMAEAGSPMARPIAEQLVDVGLWKRTDGGFLLNDFLEYNPSRSEILEKKEKEAERKKSKRNQSGSPVDVRADSARKSDGIPEPPDPDPDPNTNQENYTAPQPTLTVPDESRTVARPKRGTRLPEGWVPSAATLAWAAAEGVINPLGPLDEFRDHWRGVAGQRGVKLDWDATYRNRLRALGQRRQTGKQATLTLQPTDETASWMQLPEAR